MADKKKVTFWVGGSGGEGRGAGYINGRLFKKPGYFTTDDPSMIEALRQTCVAREIPEEADDLIGIAPDKLRTLGHGDLQEICEKLSIPVRNSKQAMITDILAIITPEPKGAGE